MAKTRLSTIAEKLGIFTFKCEYSKRCKHFNKESETCMEALDKSYCGAYKGFIGGELE